MILTSLRINQQEVSRIILIPLSWLKQPGNHKTELYARAGSPEQEVVFYEPFENEVVWGITASIVEEFVSLIEK